MVKLDGFVTTHREKIIGRCRTREVARGAERLPDVAFDRGVPLFLDQLVDELRSGLSTSDRIVCDTATRHGVELLRHGFSIGQVVHGYGDVCQSITELAVELNAPISTGDFRLLNRCLDDAIASAVTSYSRAREPETDSVSDEADSLVGLAGELRTALNTADVALAVIRSGRVGITGSTGTLLSQTLSVAHDLVDRLVTKVGASPHRA